MNLKEANTILQKIGCPEIVPAGHFERRVNEYGEAEKWVLRDDTFQARRGYHTVAQAFAASLKTVAVLNIAVLTPKRQGVVNAALGKRL